MSVAPQLDEQLKRLLHLPERELAGIAVAVVRGGALHYEGYFGRRYIDPAGQRDLPLTAETRFRVASISKAVATLGLMRLVEQGQMHLAADVSEYLPFVLRHPRYPDLPLTLRHLLSHTSSIGDDPTYVLPLGRQLAECFDPHLPEGAQRWHPHPPGSYFSYGNLNYGVLATALEQVTGQRFDHYMRQHLLTPLGIEASYNVALFDEALLPHIAALYRRQDGRWVAQADDYGGVKPSRDWSAYEIGANGTLSAPQGGLRISVRGLVTLMQLLLHDGRHGDQSLWHPQTIDHILTPHWRYDPAQPAGETDQGLMRCWGLGFQRFTHTGGAGAGDKLVEQPVLEMWGHLGDAYGLLSGFFFNRQHQHGLVYVISGTAVPRSEYLGHYSSFSRWEEQILTLLAPLLVS